MKYEIQAINETYNVIILEIEDHYEYYLEKVGDADLFYIFGYFEKIENIKELILKKIEKIKELILKEFN